ncbi:PD-(D/E)XK nuclease family protein [uncultured Hymenobacter sp.]|uniref:PD-(D/E)XK nuclease family protein n=1 Tax=uncultured Hymenobacter sp. TaxID=170016 RepID=UPI0035CA01E4
MPAAPLLSLPPLLPPTAAGPVSFLAQAAQELVEAHDPEALSDLVVIVPTRRAVVYFKNELALATAPGEALWSPRVAAMEDYMVELAGVQVEEPIALQLLLFDILRHIDQDLDFDRFVGWSGLLLTDFSNLDQNLASPRKVFEYLSQAKALERWELEVLPEKSQAARYFHFWDQLERVYRELKRRMLAQHIAYPGLAYRLAVEKLEKRLRNAAEPAPAQHLFLGLGLLSKAEERLIQLLSREGRAELRFDADPFYLEEGSVNRAGQFLRRYLSKNSWGLPREAFGDGTEYLRGQPHRIRFVGVANASMQGKVAGQLLAEARQANPEATVAVVLPDETLLLPVLHGLPPDAVPHYNVTMGLSFQSTPLFNLVDLLFEVHLTGIREGSAGTGYGVPRYHHGAVSKLISHPFLRRYQRWLNQQPGQPQDLLDHVCREIVRRNAVLLNAEDLLQLGHQHPLIRALFATWDNCDDIIRACYTLIDLLREVYQDKHSGIEAEYLYLFYTLVKQLDSAFDCREQRLSVRSFRRFLYEQMARTRLPFSGEPLADIQVMGLLETRALDFNHVIILSCNENVLPAPKRHGSLFPYDVLKEFNLPTYADAESSAAYNFWRLLQRAGRADLVYVLPGAEGTRTGERSRFLLQIENDLALQSPQLVLEDLVAGVAEVSPAGPFPETPSPSPFPGGERELAASSSSNADVSSGSRLELVTSPPSPSGKGLGDGVSGKGDHTIPTPLSDLVLEKDPEMLRALRGVLERGLSPSALNEFLTCSLKFYFSRLARFQENDEVEETLGTDGFGTVVHEALEELLTPFVAESRLLTEADITGLVKQVPGIVQKHLRQEEEERHARPDEGLNHLLGQVAVQLIARYLEGLTQQPGMLPLRIVALEKAMAATVFVDLPATESTAAERLPVRLYGIADRLDQLPDGRLRVVDYKTGLVEASYLNLGSKNRKSLPPPEAVERLFAETNPKADKVRQLWLYRFLVESGGQPAADAAIISMRKLDAGLLAANLDFLTAEGQSFVEASEALVGRLARRILDPAEPIRKTDDLAVCQWCPYQGICARG